MCDVYCLRRNEMAESLLNKVLNDETNLEDILAWTTNLQCQDSKFNELSLRYKCSREDFVTFFLNLIHEEVGNFSDRRNDSDDTCTEINRSHSFPQDLSSELGAASLVNSTPKIVKINSENSVHTYMSPVSPIYNPKVNFKTPKCQKSLCLGDFIVNRKTSSSKKKTNDTKKRIKPTNLSQHRANGFHKSDNSFNFNKNEFEEFPTERNVLVEERLKILSRSDIVSVASTQRNVTRLYPDESLPSASLIHHKDQLDKVVRIYVNLLNNDFVLNLTSEIYFLISLLLTKQLCDTEWGVEVLTDKITTSILFNTIHNVVYFAAKSLETQIRVLRNYDNSTVRLLVENERVGEFAPRLVDHLQGVVKADRFKEIETQRSNICFNSDTDNRENFPNDPSFHAFRKQRDLFYEVLRIWEQQHLLPGFSFVISLGGKIKTLLSLSSEPTNFIHFSKLFKAQLLSTCRSKAGRDFVVTSLEVDAQKLNKLKNRCVTKETSQGLNSLPKFSDSEEFYKEFILVGSNYCFNRHLADTLIQEIIELSDSSFNTNELDEKESDVDLATRKSYFSSVKSMRILAKFLGFLETLPYKTVSNYSDNLLGTHLQIRQKIRPNFDVKHLLESSIRRKSVILCVPWLIKYLSMLDYVTLKLPYYTAVHNNLFWVYRNFDWGPDSNVYLIKFCLGWLFELPHVPDSYFRMSVKISLDFDHDPAPSGLDHFNIVDQNILYLCCPYLDEIKKLLSSTFTSHSITVKHITPVTASQSPEEIAKKKLEQQLEEAFYNSQPLSLRKTVEFVSERVASTCVKHVCSTLVPNHRKAALEKFKAKLVVDENDDISIQKLALRGIASDFANDCLQELQEACRLEIEQISDEKIRQAIDALLPLDTLSQSRDMCVGITKKSCVERIRQWIESHVTLGVFMKDFMDHVHKCMNLEIKKSKKPVFILPPTGTNPNHNDKCASGAHLLEQYREFTIRVIERKQLQHAKQLTELLDNTCRSISERGDVNQCVIASICTQLVDLMLLFLSREPEVMMQDDVLSKSCDIWRLYYKGSDDLFRSLLCPRNVMILGQLNYAWTAFSQFCVYLLKHKLLSCDSFESQCAGIFRTSWNQVTLKLITDFLKCFIKLYREQGDSSSEFTFIIDFLSDYCEDLY